MGTEETRHVSAGLERLRQRLTRLRRVREARSRLPHSLWAAAVTMAKTYGVNRTAKALRLDYYSLKKRVEQEAAAGHGFAVATAGVPEGRAAATVLELFPPAPIHSGECLIELENVDGAKMRVHLKGFPAPDWAVLSQSSWNSRP